MKCHLSFEDWIDSVGTHWLSKKLKVHIRTVEHWRSGFCDPRVDHMRVIRRLSHRKISYEQIIDRPVLTSKVKPFKG